MQGYEPPIKEEPVIRKGTGMLLFKFVGGFLVVGLLTLVAASFYLVKNYKQFTPKTEQTQNVADFPAWMARDGITVAPPMGYAVKGMSRVSIAGMSITTVGVAPVTVDLPVTATTPDGMVGAPAVDATAIVAVRLRAPQKFLDRNVELIWTKLAEGKGVVTRNVPVGDRNVQAFDATVSANGVEKRIFLARLTVDTLVFASAPAGRFDEDAVLAAAGGITVGSPAP